MATKTGIASIDQDMKRLEKLEARSRKAKGLVGKLVSFQVADGYAYYTVEAEKGAQVLLRHQALIDGYQAHLIGGGGWFPKKQIEPIIRREEAFTKAMDENSRKNASYNEKLEKSIARAVVEDIGLNADVYDLAHWAWDRGHYGTKKGDDRIETTRGQKPWADAIAAAMERSKLFPALLALKENHAFTSLASGFEDPRIYRNLPPVKGRVIVKVREAFLEAIGMAPEEIDIKRAESKYLNHTFMDVLGKNGAKIGSVCYDPKDGSVTQVNIAFKLERGCKVTGSNA